MRTVLSHFQILKVHAIGNNPLLCIAMGIAIPVATPWCEIYSDISDHMSKNSNTRGGKELNCLKCTSLINN